MKIKLRGSPIDCAQGCRLAMEIAVFENKNILSQSFKNKQIAGIYFLSALIF
jgi:hypothetical protein